MTPEKWFARRFDAQPASRFPLILERLRGTPARLEERLRDVARQYRNNPDCADYKDEGPIPPGNNKMNQDDREGNEGFWRLEPDPPIPGWKCRLGVNRCGFMLHPGTVSLGCITADPTNKKTMRQYDRVDRLLQRENGANTLTVTQ